MKYVVPSVLCLLLTSGAFAAQQATEAPVAEPQPQAQVTEIRLTESPGFVRAPRQLSEFVFHADNTLDWTGGTDNKPVHKHYTLKNGEFQKLVASLEAQRFYDLDSLYPTGPAISDTARVIIGVTRGDQEKNVAFINHANPELKPLNLWTVEMLLRGLAWEAVHPQPTPDTN